jgi:hypothetical protein
MESIIKKSSSFDEALKFFLSNECNIGDDKNSTNFICIINALEKWPIHFKPNQICFRKSK